MDPFQLHATYPWRDGDRIILVAYHSRSVMQLPAERLGQLQARGLCPKIEVPKNGHSNR